MKPIFATLTALLLLISLAGSTAAQNTRFVLAPSGLNMRKTSNPKSEKIKSVPFGTKVELVSEPAAKDMTIDNLKGGMAKVNLNGTIGFMFSGYLSHFPAGQTGMKTEDYVNRLRNNGFGVTFEEHRYDYDGVLSFSEVFYLPKIDFEDAFLVVKSIYHIAKNYDFPPARPQKENETYPNPVKNDYSWSNEMVVKRDKQGNITEITIYLQGEGGGDSLTISIDKEGRNLKIDSSSIAD